MPIFVKSHFRGAPHERCYTAALPVDALGTNRRPNTQRPEVFGRAQLSLIEHALCPLDSSRSLRPQLLFQTSYFYSDQRRRRKKATVRVGAIDGLSAHDELYLWGLLSLALSQPEPAPEFMATPYFCLRRLEAITSGKRGGREFELFRHAIDRLAGVRYQNDAFYDPIRGEHRQVAFGLLNYSLPLDSDSPRAWRFAWDPIFFELCRAAGSTLSFDIPLYRSLDPAARRLYLFLKKVFWRQSESPDLDLRHLAVDVLGFLPSLETKHLKQKVSRCLDTLCAHGVFRLPPDCSAPNRLIRRYGPGEYRVKLHRGPAFDRETVSSRVRMTDSPLYDPLKEIGLDSATIRRIIAKYPARLVEQWADITLAARERRGEGFFTTSPQAYFVDNLQQANVNRRTPPDWWHDLRRAERGQEEEQARRKDALFARPSFDDFLAGEAMDKLASITASLVKDYVKQGQDESAAREQAEHMARVVLQRSYEKEYCAEDGPTSIGQLMQQFRGNA